MTVTEAQGRTEAGDRGGLSSPELAARRHSPGQPRPHWSARPPSLTPRTEEKGRPGARGGERRGSWPQVVTRLLPWPQQRSSVRQFRIPRGLPPLSDPPRGIEEFPRPAWRAGSKTGRSAPRRPSQRRFPPSCLRTSPALEATSLTTPRDLSDGVTLGGHFPCHGRGPRASAATCPAAGPGLRNGKLVVFPQPALCNAAWQVMSSRRLKLRVSAGRQEQVNEPRQRHRAPGAGHVEA